MNCANVCPKGLNPAKAIAETEEDGGGARAGLMRAEVSRPTLRERRARDGARPDPDHPGWFSWGDLPAESFAAQTGPMIFEPTDRAAPSCGCSPKPRHMNLGGSIHGGAVMSFIDMALVLGRLLRRHGARSLCHA